MMLSVRECPWPWCGMICVFGYVCLRHACMRTRMWMCMCVCACCMYVCMYVCMYECMLVCAFACACACACACAYVHVQTLYDVFCERMSVFMVWGDMRVWYHVTIEMFKV